MSSVVTPHFDFPFHFSGDHVAAVEQDTLEDIVNCVEVILITYIGFRPEAPSFGMPDLTFINQPIGKDHLIDLITSQEPRALLAITEHPDVFDELINRILIDVQTNGGQA